MPCVVVNLINAQRYTTFNLKYMIYSTSFESPPHAYTHKCGAANLRSSPNAS